MDVYGPVAEDAKLKGEPAEKADANKRPLDHSLYDKSATKRAKVEHKITEDESRSIPNGTAPVKQEYLIEAPNRVIQNTKDTAEIDDDGAEERGKDFEDARGTRDKTGRARGKKGKQGKKDKSSRGMNTDRDFGHSRDTLALCPTRAHANEFCPKECKYGSRCNKEHNLRKYMAEGRRLDLNVFDGQCPIWEKTGHCPMGWKCLFVRSHMIEIAHDDGTKELCLVKDASRLTPLSDAEADASLPGIVNNVSLEKKIELSRKRKDFSTADKYIKWVEEDSRLVRNIFNSKREDGTSKPEEEKIKEYRAAFVDPPFRPSEKRRVYFGRETPVLAPLTTQGNLPFRRLCVELGAGATYSEMAVSMHILQGQKSEWALVKAHESEIQPPRFDPNAVAPRGYDNSRDLKFGAQIAANAPWVAIKAAQALSEYLPHLRLIDLNCGCPIEKVFKEGAGSALLDMPSKLERIVRGMNAVSGEVPITTKLRLGVRNDRLTAKKTIERLAFGNTEICNITGASGCAAITLHGRSRQQRYRSAADWNYIAECGAMIQEFREKKAELTDTVREPDQSTLSNGGRMYFLGNGDCYSHIDYFEHLDNARVDTVMIARGALIKPWVFEEIDKGQFLDKSATERLSYIEKFARYGIEAWGSDEFGLGTTRKFLLEYLSFAHRYVPIGILEHLPPKINDRPPAYRGRDALETLLASNNYKDWIKISEMFLGPAPDGFKFEPKHKSNAYEVEVDIEG